MPAASPKGWMDLALMDLGAAAAAVAATVVAVAGVGHAGGCPAAEAVRWAASSWGLRLPGQATQHLHEWGLPVMRSDLCLLATRRIRG